MARYPKAVWRPVPATNDPKIIPIGVILHVDAGNASSLYNYFNGPSGGIESHFHLNEDLTWEQYHDTTVEADANYRGNSWIGADGKRYGFISVETQGYADGRWTDGMVRELVEFIRWAAKTHDFPLRRAPSYRSPGIGYHVMFGTGPGTNSWSNATGKVCPGPRRIAQFNEVILPRIATGMDIEMNADQERVLQGVKNDTAALINVAERPLEVEKRLNVRLERLESAVAELKASGAVGNLTKDDVKAAVREVLGSLND